MCGVDLTRIDGIDMTTPLAVISETGADISRLPSDKHFASWMGLCPGTDHGRQGDERQVQALCQSWPRKRCGWRQRR